MGYNERTTESPKYEDAFDNIVTDRTNVLDIAAHYPYSPERWRLFVDGSRVFPEYNTVSQYNHATDVHELRPNAGETVVFETAERPRYVVAYELAVTMAFSLNQELTGGDKIKVGLYDGSNGWYMEHNANHSNEQADFVSERGGTEVYRETDVDILDSIQSFDRLKLKTAWYNITRQDWERSYTSDGTQINGTIGEFSADGQRGPEVGNLPIRFEVTADANTTDLILNAGSVAQVNLGRTVPLLRQKVSVLTDSITTTDVWEPLRAFRVKPDRDVVNTQVVDIDVAAYTVSETVELLMLAFSPSKVLEGDGTTLDDADFSTPIDQSETNSAIETSTAVEQIPDSTGTPQTSVVNPGGYQLQRAELFDATANQSTGQTEVSDGVKRSLYPRDVGVIIGKSASTGDVTYQIQFNQDW